MDGTKDNLKPDNTNEGSVPHINMGFPMIHKQHFPSIYG